MPTNYLGRILLIAFIVLAALWALFPQPHRTLQPNLNPGIDMVGGVRLVYEIKAPPGGFMAGNLAEQVMDALKRRVDPDGRLNLIWRPQGNTRLEIQMPMTRESRAAAQMRDRYIAAQNDLERGNVLLGQVIQAIDRGNTELLEEFTHGSPRRAELFEQMIDVHQQIQQAREARNAARQARLELEFEGLRREVQLTNLHAPQMEALLALSPEARQQRLNELVERFADFPDRPAAIGQFVEAYDAFDAVRDHLDDAESIKRLLRGSGVLQFHIVVEDLSQPQAQEMIQRLHDRGPIVQAGDTMRWLLVERPEEFRNQEHLSMQEYNEQHWMLVYTTPDRSLVNRPGAPRWSLTSAYPTQDRMGVSVVGFTFDAQGASLFGALTRENVGRPMAIVLDERIISAPNIQTAIEGGSGIITGDRTRTERAFLISTLNAGSLPAQLTDEPIMEQTIGPSLGLDNLRRGLFACIAGLIVVTIFMVAYYYLAGIVAGIALFLNMVLILGVMAGFNFTFTLPGVAAIVLTIGMAVDANVLIFERLREEQLKGLSLRMALRNGYDKALSAILDANITTAITAFLLYWFGSEEVAGFGLTLMIGIAASLFTALVVTKTVFGIMIDKFGLQNLNTLPLTFPRWEQILNPKWNWIGKAKLGYAFSVVFISIGLTIFGMRWAQDEILDVEFTSGTAMQFELEEALPIDEVRAMFEDADPAALPAHRIVTVGATQQIYELITPNIDLAQVREEVLTVLGDRMRADAQRPATFANMNTGIIEARQFNTVVPITDLDMEFDGFQPENLAAYHGGVAIVLRNLDPPLAASDIQNRINRQRIQVQVTGAPVPQRDFIVETPEDRDEASGLAVVLASDPALAYADDPIQWRDGLADPMWTMVVEAVHRPAQMYQVNNFDPQVAGEFRRAAMIAFTLAIIVIMIYIWLRFGNFKYGTATVVALVHDTAFVLAAIGWAHFLVGLSEPLATLLLLENFRIDLTMIAALLTVIGYSMNDTIVVFDRIRENRGKFGVLSRQVINDSITQTLSRTLLTSGTTLGVVLIMYIFGGAGIHGFAFALLVGIIAGTYSSILIAAPILLAGGETVDAGAPRKQPAKRLQHAG